MRHSLFAVLVTIAGLAITTPAVAQPYVYAATGFAIFRGQHLTQFPTSRLVTIDPASGQAIASLWLTGCTNATGLAVRSDGLRVFVSCASQGPVVAVDPVAKQIVATRPFPQVAGGVAITPSGDRLVVPIGGGLPAEVLDATSLTTIGTITGSGGFVSGNQQPVVISNDGLTAYIAESLSSSGRLLVASLAGFTVTNTIDFGADNISAIALTGDGSRLVVRHHNGKVSIVATGTNTVEGTVTLPADANPGGSPPTPGLAHSPAPRPRFTSSTSPRGPSPGSSPSHGRKFSR